MASAPLPSDPLRVPLRRRAAAFVLAVAANLLLLALLLGLVPALPGPPPAGRGPTVITLSPDASDSPSPSESPAAKSAPARAERARTATAAAPRPVPPPPVIPPVETARPLPMIVLTPDEFASADIGRMPKRGAAQGAETAESGGPGAASSGKGGDGSIGVGPNGERLYKADWVREPTDAELATYLPRNDPGSGYGVVACRTVARNRVEDCAEVAESPAGSGYARSVRLAAWQFLVRPPRVGGRTLVGAWVQIRITYSRRRSDD